MGSLSGTTSSTEDQDCRNNSDDSRKSHGDELLCLVHGEIPGQPVPRPRRTADDL